MFNYILMIAHMQLRLRNILIRCEETIQRRLNQK